MSSGYTFVSNVDEGLDTTIAAARTTREYAADTMLKVCDRQTLPPGTGTSWREWLATALTAQNVGETEDYDNPQQLDGSVLSFTPQLVVIQTFIGKRVQERLNPKAYQTFGQLAQQAIDRKKDEDGLAVFSTATTVLGGTGVTLTAGHADAGARRITSNVTEPGERPIAIVLHGFGIHDIFNQIIAGMGTYPTPTGYTETTFKEGFQGMMMGANVYEDGNISVDSTPDALGAVFSKMSLLCVQGMSPWTDREYVAKRGYGGWNVWLKDEYIWGERSPGNWCYGLRHDATSPTS